MRDRIANVLTGAGFLVFIFGMIFGPSPDDYLDVWFILAGTFMMVGGFLVGDVPIRHHKR